MCTDRHRFPAIPAAAIHASRPGLVTQVVVDAVNLYLHPPSKQSLPQSLSKLYLRDGTVVPLSCKEELPNWHRAVIVVAFLHLQAVDFPERVADSNGPRFVRHENVPAVLGVSGSATRALQRW